MQQSSEREVGTFGLTEAEAAARRARGEGNPLAAQSSRSYVRILFDNAVTPINVSLFAICAGLVVLGLVGDAAMTASLVVANVFVGVVQETRAKRTLDRISLLTRPAATVSRQGRERTVPAEEVVLGDRLVLRPGDQIVADGTVLTENGLAVDESLLTGESDLVPKHTGALVQSGTFCMNGGGAYVAEQVGANSLAQQLTAQARKFRSTQTPLQREVGLVIRVMAVAILALSIAVLAAIQGYAEEGSARESLRAGAVLVGLIPQGLSFMVTTTYAMAVIRMAGSGALIQRINAVESTSNVNLLCLDKTGTLTTNELVLDQVHPLGKDPAAGRTLLADYCASISTPNRTSEAIHAALAGRKRDVGAEIPFSSERKWSAAEIDGVGYVLGAPEVLQPALGSDSVLNAEWSGWARAGLRVLLFASVPSGTQFDTVKEPRLPEGLVPLGVITLRDELRPDARETIARFEATGIAVKIISGDNPETVDALARQAGLTGDIATVSGLSLDGLNDTEFARVAEEGTVFGRITPQQKERLIRALRRPGRHVAMIGDGVNDVLAMKQADLAIALKSGSQVTRSVADIVLLDDSFSALPKVFVEGQRIRRGMLDIIRLFLVRTLSVSLVILAATIAGSEFPTTPRQSGVLSFLTVGIPTLALAIWAQPAHTPRRLVLSSAYFVVPAAVSIALVTFGVYHVYLSIEDVATARSALTTAGVFCGLILVAFAQPPVPAFGGGAELNGDWRPTLLALALAVVYAAILAIDPLRSAFELERLTAQGYLVITLVALVWAIALRQFWRSALPRRRRTTGSAPGDGRDAS